MRRLPPRDHATMLALVFVVVALAAVGIAAALLADSQADQRRELRERYADRVDVATALVSSLLDVAYNGSREEAMDRYAGPVSRRTLDAATERGNAPYLVILDESGRVVASSSGTPAGTAQRLAARPKFIERALTSRVGYGLGDIEGDVVEAAIAFPVPGGRRLLISAAEAATFRNFLRGALAPVPQGREGRAWVFDRNGAVVSSVNVPPGFAPAPQLVQRSLREPMGEFTSPNTGQERFFAADSIPNSDWRVVTGVPTAALYATVSGGARWTPWVILGIAALALVGVALLLRRLLRTRERLHRANVSLEESRLRLEERAAELERSNADLEQFAYAASHDLSEPLRTVAGFSQLLGSRYRGRLDDEADEMIRYMGDGVERMQQLIDDLLLYSRVGRTPLREERVSLDAVLAEARAWLGPAVADRGARITSDPLPEVRGERGQLTQVFQNLVGNAIKFTAPGVTPAVHVSAASVGGEWRISVADNGIGVETEQEDAIFKMFGRLHPADAYPGTGIGLALVKRIVERHGGRIWVEPGAEGGSVFVFTLPDRVRTTRAAEQPSPEAVA